MNTTILNKAWEALDDSIVYYKNQPVGTVAARDPQIDALNYDQVFTRDFAISAMAFMLNGRHDIVKNFLSILLELQSREKSFDCFDPGQGLMPVSFKVEKDENGREHLNADFGEKAIGKVAPVDAVFWWLYILRIYTRLSGDKKFYQKTEVQKGIRLILDLSLPARFDMFPTLLVQDGSFMIDRRMGVYGYPLDIQSLFYMALLSAKELLTETKENHPYIEGVKDRLGHLIYHIRKYYWLDMDQLNEMYRYDVEGYGGKTRNVFNIYPDAIPQWLFDWLPDKSGYFAGNLGPGRMDFRFFSSGNLMAVISSLAGKDQADQILNLIERRWDQLIGYMPLKVCFPALEETEWKTLTGGDPKNTAWSYHNAAGWPFLLWVFTAAAIKNERPALAEQAMALAEKRIEKDQWPEYYDGKQNRMIGKEARLYQTWTFAGYIAAFAMLKDPESSKSLAFGEDQEVIACSTKTQTEYEQKVYFNEPRW
jgi:glycogen debranching enzyme